MPLLELTGIHKYYRRGGLFGSRERFPVLTDVDLTVEHGACLGLLGRSGAGKSTLGRIALGLEPPDRGEVRYAGRPLRDLGGKDYREFRRNVQVVFQNSLGSVNPGWSAGRIVAEPLRNFERLSPADLRERVRRLLTQVGLAPADAGKYPHQFSGGELQRVCIARALALEPRLIVLDEAVSSLDMLVQGQVIDLLSDLQRRSGTAYLLISHDIRVLLKMADRLAVMEGGRIVAGATPVSALEGLTQDAWARLLAAVLPPNPTPSMGLDAPARPLEAGI